MELYTTFLEFFEILKMLLGFFDVVLLSLIILINWYIYKYRKFTFFPWYIHLILGLSFLILLPFISSIIEYTLYINRTNVTPDGFETLYIWFRWPTYWFIGLVEGVIMNLILNRNGFINEGWQK